MKKTAKLPTILGIVILVIGLFSGVLLINSRAVFKLGAQTAANPKDVRISNITDKSVTVSWTTDVPSKGFIKYGSSDSNLNKVAPDTFQEDGYTHWTTILNLNPGDTIYFKINSNGQDWDNNGIAWQTQTLASVINLQQSHNISGSIVDQSGNPSANSLVYVSVEGKLLSTTTSTNGNWVLPLSNYTSFNGKNSVLEISVNAGQNGSSTAIIYPDAAKNTPLIALGRSYDFRTIDITASENLPESDLTVPEQVESSSRFEIGNLEKIDTTTVTLDSVDEGEIITTTDPEFFGSAPKGTEIEIIVESEVQTTTLKAGSSNKWSWSPPENLEPGQHTLTIKWKDANGILRTITRTFVVSAAEGPAFESTPSATPTQTATAKPTATSTSTSTPISTPTVTATAKSSATPTLTATSSSAPKLPDSGVLTPTLGLFIMGLGVLLSSIFVWRTAGG